MTTKHSAITGKSTARKGAQAPPVETPEPKNRSILFTVVGVFIDAYWAELKSRNTLGYRTKQELIDTAASASAGVEALRQHAKMCKEREQRLANYGRGR